MKKIVFDVDGVIRNLGYIHDIYNIPRTCDWKWEYKGKDIYDWVKKDFNVLLNAPPTKYLSVIQKYKNGGKLEFWSHQPLVWRKYTLQWLRKYFGNNFIIRYLKPEDKYKRLKNCKNTLLLEDYGFYPNYKRILLIDRYYNRNANAPIRIKTIKQLKEILNNA